MFASVLQIIGVGAVIIFLACIEYLDWRGRFDVIKEKHPRVWGAMNNRPAGLILLTLCMVMLVKDYRDAVATAPAPVVKTSPPPAPIMQVSSNTMTCPPEN